MPKGLFARALIIIIAPMIILQSVIAYAFMERHWQTVTRRLSAAVTQDIAALIDIAQSYPQDKDYETLTPHRGRRLGLDIEMLPAGALPPAGSEALLLHPGQHAFARIRTQIGRPFWIDTVGRSNIVEIRIQLDKGILRVLTRRSQAYASNSHIFLMWMVGTASCCSASRCCSCEPDPPILRLAQAAEASARAANRVPAARRARGAAGRARLHRDAPAHRARHGAADGDAERRQPRPPHHSHALQALPRFDGRGGQRRDRGRSRRTSTR